MGYRTSSTDSVLFDIDPAGHCLEGWIYGSVKPKYRIPSAMDSKEENATGHSVLRLEVNHLHGSISQFAEVSPKYSE